MTEETALITTDAPETGAVQTLDMVSAVDVPAFYQNASGLTITSDEQAALLADFDESEIEIRPDGLIYLPQSFFRSRLNQVFGVGQWALIQHRTHMDANYMYFDGSLYVRGCFVARAMGEAQKHSDNKGQSWAGVYESAKSDCIVRCCKDLSIAAKLWQPAFGRKWIESHAVKVWREGENGRKGRFEWRRKDAPPFWWEQKKDANKAPQTSERAKEASSHAPQEKTQQRASKAPVNAADWVGREGEFALPEGKNAGKALDELDIEVVKAAHAHYAKSGSPIAHIIQSYIDKLPAFMKD